MVRALIADPDPATRRQLSALFDGSGLQVDVTADGLLALRRVLDHDVDIVVAELGLPGMDGLTLLRELQRLRPDVAVILLAAFGTVEDAVQAMRMGAFDFLSKPYSDEQVRLTVDRTLERLELVRENRQLREALDDRVRLANMVAADPKMHAVFKTVKAVAASRATVLLTGESGTGKTLIARALHSLSPRSSQPFIEVNCGALPENLLESELFGHVRGAFTGAVKDRPGKFEAADSGTIFLDEIGTSTPGLQVKLLRVLQDRIVERVGDTQSIPVDVRVVLATNLDLAAEVREKRFREDLYYRINVVAVEVPPLRDRRSDIIPLAEHFLRRFAAENDKPITTFAPDALRVLCTAELPGNVRQLENLVERAVVLSEGSSAITAHDLPAGLSAAPALPPATTPPTATPAADTPTAATPAADTAAAIAPDAHLLPLKRAMEAPEKLIIQRALEAHSGNRQQTAESLGINRSTLFNKMRKFGLL